mgnify:CR=1 FL=1
MTPEQALNVLAQVAALHLCNKQDRVTIDQAIETLARLVQQVNAVKPAE